jgi:dCMP deaminase
MAKMVASWSKDPSTKVGAVLVRPPSHVICVGLNGFTQEIEADDERLHDEVLKHELSVHAEMDALMNAERNIAGCTIYTWPLMMCSRCTKVLLKAGIRRHVAPITPEARWRKAFEISTKMLSEAKAELTLYDKDECF